MNKIKLQITLLALIIAAFAAFAQAQTTAFTYQGKLNDGTMAASGTYDLGFALYDAETGGNLIGTAITRPNVTVSGGVFTVSLDFGAAAFPGASRFLQIAVRKTTETNFITLTPRQPVTSTPYSMQSLNATNATNATNAVNATNATNAAQLGGSAASNFVQTDSTAFVRNQTTQQSSTNFNISGDGVFGSKVGIGMTAAPTIASLQVNGGILARGGAPGAPGVNNNGYAFSGNGGDNDSGMFSTANGTLQFFVDGGERMRLTRSIDLTAANGDDAFVGTGGTGAGITLQAGSGGRGGVDGGVGGNGASITLQPGGGGIANGTSGNVILAPTNGNVGIGTTNPTSKLFVNGNLTVTGTISGILPAGSANYIQNSTTQQTSSNFNISGNGIIGGNLTANSAAVNGETERILNVQSSSPTGTWLTLKNTTTGGRQWSIISTGSNNGEGAGKLLFYDSTTGAERLLLSSNGVNVTGSLTVSGAISGATKNFKIDHPLDPQNKTLTYTSVESPDMKNIYDGNITTDVNGEATVTMPDYFEALNKDFRYQLTVIGTFAQAIVSEEIKGNQFKLKTDQPNVKVSWQITGIRKDKFAEDNRPKVEETKTTDEQGKCIYAPACMDAPKR